MKLNINKPCNEDWNAMKIGMISKHCDVCDKGVFDFTNKTKEEILRFLIEKNNQFVCGRLRKSQLDFHHNELEIIIESLKKQNNNKYAFAILSLACLAIVSCSEPAPSITNTQNDKVVIEKSDTIVDVVSIKDTLIKKPICETQNNYSKKGNDSIISEIEVPDMDIMGVMIFEPDTSGPVDTNSVMSLASEMPEFVGGIDSLFAFLQENLVYPKKERASNTQGKVYVNFIVDRDGSVIEPKILRGLTDNCDKEVIRVMKLMPKWIPGEHKGEKVKASYNLPINFALTGK